MHPMHIAAHCARTKRHTNANCVTTPEMFTTQTNKNNFIVHFVILKHTTPKQCDDTLKTPDVAPGLRHGIVRNEDDAVGVS